jgi:hypothetical protein
MDWPELIATALKVKKTEIFETLYYQLKWVRADVIGLVPLCS